MTERPELEELSPDILASYRVAHLEMIQGVIDRMAGYCAALKNFCVTIVAALLAVGLDKGQGMKPLVVVGFIILFGVLDAYYLGLERRYRAHFNEVRKRPLSRAPEFDMAAPHSATAWLG